MYFVESKRGRIRQRQLHSNLNPCEVKSLDWFNSFFAGLPPAESLKYGYYVATLNMIIGDSIERHRVARATIRRRTGAI